LETVFNGYYINEITDTNPQEQAETAAANGEEANGEEVDAVMDGKGSSIQEQAETAAANGERVDAAMDGKGSSILEQAETAAANGEEVNAVMDGEGSSILEQLETAAANGEEVDAVVNGEGSSIQEQAETEAAGKEMTILTTPQKRKYINIANRKSDTKSYKEKEKRLPICKPIKCTLIILYLKTI
jgi:ribosomal protein S12